MDAGAALLTALSSGEPYKEEQQEKPNYARSRLQQLEEAAECEEAEIPEPHIDSAHLSPWNGKSPLPYDLSSLTWDYSHSRNNNNCYCYCGQSKTKWSPMYRCHMCQQLFHSECLNNQSLVTTLLGDANYKFKCGLCAGTPETFEHLHKSWSDIVRVAIYNLLQIEARRGGSKRFFQYKEEICNYVDKKWDSLCYGKTSQYRTKTWENTIGSALSTKNHYFKSGAEQMGTPGYWGLQNENDPSTFKSAGGQKGPKKARREKTEKKEKAPKAEGAVKIKKRKSELPNDEHKEKKQRKHKLPPFPEAAVIGISPFPTATPKYQCLSRENSAPQIIIQPDHFTMTNDKGYRMARASNGTSEGSWYFEIEVLPHKGNARLGWSTDKGDNQAPVGYDLHSYSYRDKEGTKFHQSRGKPYGAPWGSGDVIGFYIKLPPKQKEEEKKEEKEIEKKEVEERGDKLEEKEEKKEEEKKEEEKKEEEKKEEEKKEEEKKEEEKRGESDMMDVEKKEEAKVEEKVEEKREGEEKEEQKREGEKAEIVQTNDAMEIEKEEKTKTEEPTNNSQVPDQPHPTPTAVVDGHNPEKKERAPPTAKAPPKEPEKLLGSEIIFYKNGESQGTAFTDLYEGTYYPAASCYMGAIVRFNFGPEFKFPPSDVTYRPACEIPPPPPPAVVDELLPPPHPPVDNVTQPHLTDIGQPPTQPKEVTVTTEKEETDAMATDREEKKEGTTPPPKPMNLSFIMNEAAEQVENEKEPVNIAWSSPNITASGPNYGYPQRQSTEPASPYQPPQSNWSMGVQYTPVSPTMISHSQSPLHVQNPTGQMQMQQGQRLSPPKPVQQPPQPHTSGDNTSNICLPSVGNKPPRPLDNAISGTLSGAFSTILFHPLDLIKTRLQVQDGQKETLKRTGGLIYKGTTDALIKIVRSDGAIGLYQGWIIFTSPYQSHTGLTPNLIGASSAWGLYFWAYTLAKDQMISSQKSDASSSGTVQLSPTQHLLAGFQAGTFTAIVTNPIWVVKTRIQLQQKSGNHGKYSGVTVPGLFGVTHGALQFMAYEEIKRYLTRGGKTEENLSSIHFLVMGGLSKIFATVTTYPFQVVRSRLQQRPDDGGVRVYTGTLDTVLKTFRNEGLFGFYKGLFPNLLRVVPSASVTFLAYENIMKILQRVH
ncbi:hypothetical protein PROFUN_03008 [Planoprotostelium fungivorum]|uniref:B30.2/SPRY domain-containing protein n=1 Tax=Planoprotostelium fungivorum TaxID=1890364 RepID=A0A2P6NXC1_9EUKA|nr:hypothetical protein PROFUN_03008 [Planoprotostelium fungivorum]